ncbi:hypothetical protein EVAR_88871_1 [Eumeta japonica]|uniref:Uncharacterized protein n=1 Tax=Eumeta variegata TaxID=151549 RepID=A0A4C1XZT1_EUMVA|nr:hypothetical protein EVAR_88871_1 [Eumeta japonica]
MSVVECVFMVHVKKMNAFLYSVINSVTVEVASHSRRRLLLVVSLTENQTGRSGAAAADTRDCRVGSTSACATASAPAPAVAFRMRARAPTMHRAFAQ